MRRGSRPEERAPMSTLRSILSLRRASLRACTLALALASACASAGRPMPEVTAEINATLDPLPARFLPGDSMAVRFAHDANLDQTVQVDSNGSVSLLLIGSVNIAGKRPDQVREELEAAYKPKLAAPDLTVNLIEFTTTDSGRPNNRMVYVLGEVRAPGGYAIGGRAFTLIESIARAGGQIKSTASIKNVLLVRWMPADNHWRAWHIDARIDHWGASNQILLQANDLVFLNNTPIDDVDIRIDHQLPQLLPFPPLIP